MRFLKHVMKDESGNFGVMTALVLVPLLGAAGLAIDFGRALGLQAELSAAADAAAVGAVATRSAAVAQAITMTGNGTVALAPDEARRLFFGQISSSSIDVPVEVDIQLEKTNGTIVSRVSYRATLPTTLLQVMGQMDLTVSNVATAIYQTPSFIDFYMLLDNTPSMGIAATADAIKAMKKATLTGYQGPGSNRGKEPNCAFACHIVSQTGTDDPFSYYNVARNNGIPIRIDIVADAVKALMLLAKNSQTVPGQYRMAAYTFGEKAEDARLFKVAGLNENLTTVAAATDRINLMSIPYQNYDNDQQTSFDEVLEGIRNEILTEPLYGVPGNGTSKSDRQKVVFLVADGVGDSYKPAGCTRKKVDNTPGRCIEPIDTRFCTALKAQGVRLAVVYTTYLPFEDYFFWNDWVKPFTKTISARMQECASPGYFFEVSLGDDLPQVLEILFRKLVSTPRITS